MRQGFLVVLTVVNLAILMFTLAPMRPAAAQGVAATVLPVLVYEDVAQAPQAQSVADVAPQQWGALLAPPK